MSDSLCPNTSSKSILHWLARQRGPGCERPRRITAYLVVLAVSFLPLLVTALVDARRGLLPLWQNFSGGSVPFFEDLGFLYALLISLPSLVVLLISDEYLLSTSLAEVQQDRVLVLSPESFTLLKQRWTRYFQRINII